MKRQEFVDNVQKLFNKSAVELGTSEHSNYIEYFRASGISDCPRALTLNMLNLPTATYPRPAGKDDSRRYKILRRGTDDHEYIQKVFMYMKVLMEGDLENGKAIYDEEYLFSGHPDGILTFDDDKILLELKTINARGWEFIKEPKENHYYQAQAYIHFLGKQYGITLSGVLFIYINRESDDMAFKSFWMKRDEEAIELILNKLKVMREYLQKGEVYPIPDGYNPEDKFAIPCRWCPFNTPFLCRSKKTKVRDFPGASISPNIYK